MKYRLNKFLARAGHGPRRSVEGLISGGRVSLNGTVVRDLGTTVDSDIDKVEVDGFEAVLPVGFRVYAFNKPAGVVCTLRAQKEQVCLSVYRDEAGLETRMNPVGRLDAESSGLLLWTDDGDLAQALCRPDSGVWKVYELLLDRTPTPDEQEAIRSGQIRIDGRPCLEARLDAGETPRRWRLQLHEGRNRQVRRMTAAAGLPTLRLIRHSVGPWALNGLEPGQTRQLPDDDAWRQIRS